MLGAVLALRLPADVAVTIGTRQAALVVEDTRFNPAVQLLSELEFSVGVALPLGEPPSGLVEPPFPRHVLGAEVGVALGAVKQSATIGNTNYRGLTMRSMIASGGWRSPSGAGVEVGGRAVFATYDLTNALFFFPEAYLAPLVRVPLSRASAVEWSIPLSWQFRVDLAIAFSVGVQARLALEFGAP